MSEQHPIELIRDPSEWSNRQPMSSATTQIQYVSQGHCLVLGEPAAALTAIAGFTGTGFTVVHVDPTVATTQKRLTEDGVAVFEVPMLSLTGYLGAYEASVPAAPDSGDKAYDLGVAVYRESGLFDVVLDLSKNPLLGMRLPPFGYCHAPTTDSVPAAIELLNELQGEFEKPRYFNYNESVCAHSRSELTGCNRCIEVCATNAISSVGEGISVDPFLCQGCGSCATVCPSGAMSYAYPKPADALERTRKIMKEQSAHTIVLHTEALLEELEDIANLNGVLALHVEEVSAFGPDYWLAMLAGPANQIFVVIETPADDPNRLALNSQLLWLEPMLANLGVTELPIHLLDPTMLRERLTSVDASGESESLGDAGLHPLSGITPQFFATHNDKRQTLRLALDALSEQLPPATPIVGLPAGAPFGQIIVDTCACTLCMACVSTCPAKALQDGRDTPALRFVESNCLQCGLCETACPESAISLEARFTWDSVVARQVRTLHKEVPFHCERCHVAFTTQAMIDTMSQKLAGHWMFQDEKAKKRLRLCGDCRVRDMFEEETDGINVHKDPV